MTHCTLRRKTAADHKTLPRKAKKITTLTWTCAAFFGIGLRKFFFGRNVADRSEGAEGKAGEDSEQHSEEARRIWTP